MKFLICFIAFCLPFLGENADDATVGRTPSELRAEKAVNKLIGEVSRALSRKYRMQTSGVFLAMPDEIVKELGLRFDIEGPLTKEQLREVLVGSAQFFIHEINNSEELRPYLETYPATVENIDLVLYIGKPIGQLLQDPQIGIASVRNGELHYVRIRTFGDVSNHDKREIESFEEALKALEIGKNQG